jgi:hypothetical protein
MFGNKSVWEMRPPPRGPGRNKPDPNREIRMLRPPRAVHSDPRQTRAQKLEHERDVLREQLGAAHSAIIELSVLVAAEHITPQTAAIIRKLVADQGEDEG